MSATSERDQACSLARRNPRKALEKAQSVSDPWFRAQALACVVRYTEDEPIKVARRAAKAAGECDDAYQRTAVRAWEIVALAERSLLTEARHVLSAALVQSRRIIPLSSRAEALMLLLQAAFSLGDEDAESVADELRSSCGHDSHWRCKRAIREASKLVDGKTVARPFFCRCR